jgi:tetratricopeptide (TPR) repeat protein
MMAGNPRTSMKRAFICAMLGASLIVFTLNDLSAADTPRTPDTPDAPQQMIAKGRELLGGPKQAQGIKLIKQAMAQLNKTIEKNPKDHTAHYQLSLGLYQMRQDDKAMQALERAIEIESNVAQYHVFQARIYQANNRHDDAVHAVEAALKLKPKDRAIRIDLARARWNAGQFKVALAELQAMLKEKSDASDQDGQEGPKGQVDVVYYIGSIYMQQKKYDLAVVQFLKVAKLTPQLTNPHFLLGQCYRLMGQLAEALKHFQRVIEISPNDYRGRARTIQIYQAQGKIEDRDKARTALIALRQSGKSPSLNRQSRFFRDEFAVGTEKLRVFEYFDFKGPRAVRYAFYILDLKGDGTRYRITLGSYDVTNDVAQATGQIKKGERLFHLDGYFSGNGHTTYGMFKGEPSYDEIKKQVAKIVSGKQKAISGSKPNRAGGVDVEIK